MILLGKCSNINWVKTKKRGERDDDDETEVPLPSLNIPWCTSIN